MHLNQRHFLSFEKSPSKKTKVETGNHASRTVTKVERKTVSWKNGCKLRQTTVPTRMLITKTRYSVDQHFCRWWNFHWRRNKCSRDWELTFLSCIEIILNVVCTNMDVSESWKVKRLALSFSALCYSTENLQTHCPRKIQAQRIDISAGRRFYLLYLGRLRFSWHWLDSIWICSSHAKDFFFFFFPLHRSLAWFRPSNDFLSVNKYSFPLFFRHFRPQI